MIMDFRKLKFIKNATNNFGRFKVGDRAQARFPKALVDAYLKHGILEEVEEPIALDRPVKKYVGKTDEAKDD